MPADNTASKEKFPWGHLCMALSCPRCLAFSAGWSPGEHHPSALDNVDLADGAACTTGGSNLEVRATTGALGLDRLRICILSVVAPLLRLHVCVKTLDDVLGQLVQPLVEVDVSVRVWAHRREGFIHRTRRDKATR